IAAPPGAVLDPDAPVVLEIADLTAMTAEIAIAEGDVNQLREGSEAYVTTLGSGSRRWPGTVRQVLPVPSSRDAMLSYIAVVDLDNTDLGLKSAMTVTGVFPLASAENVLIVPVAAL